MTLLSFALQSGADSFGTLGDLVFAAGSLILVLVVIAFVGFAYKSLRGDGIEWPDDVESEDGLRSGDEDDDWDYY